MGKTQANKMDAQKVSYFSLFKIREYTYLWFGQVVSNLGDYLYQTAFYWLVYKMSSSTWLAGIVLMIAASPYLFFGLIGGAYADRLDRRKIMLLGDLIRAIVIMVIPILDWYHSLKIWHLATAAFIIASVRCFFYPSFRATLTLILPEEQRLTGNSFLQASFQAMRIIGPSIGGFLIAVWGAPSIYLLGTFSYAVSFFTLYLLRLPQHTRTESKTGIFSDFYQTIKFIVLMRPLFISILFFGIGLCLFVGLQRLGFPILSEQVWGMGSEGYGMLISAFGVGNVIGSLVIGKMKITEYTRYIFMGWGLWGLFFLLIGISDVFPFAFLLSFMTGFSEALIDVPMVTLIQSSVPEEKLGKVFSMWSTMAYIGESATGLFNGALIEYFGVKHSFIVCGGTGMIMGLLCIMWTWSAQNINNAREMDGH